VRLLVTLAGAGALALLGLVLLARSGAPRRASWLPVRARMVAECEKTNLGRGVEVGLTRRYCACLQGTVESRWYSFDYQNRYQTHVREMEADGTLARCAERGPPPPETAGAADTMRRSWAPWRAQQLASCAAAGSAGGWSKARTATYCECLMSEIETRWSVDEFRERYATISAELATPSGAIARCSIVAEGLAASKSP
jgi:hypothetical protein